MFSSRSWCVNFCYFFKIWKEGARVVVIWSYEDMIELSDLKIYVHVSKSELEIFEKSKKKYILSGF